MLIRLLILLSLASLSYAEPSPTVNRLMDEPASMFDIGMLRLRDFNKTVWVPKLEGEVLDGENTVSLKSESVGYDFNDNRITLGVVFMGKPNENICSSILIKYKNTISSLRTRSPKMAATFFAGHFDHVNYSISGAPENWHQEIVNITRIMVGIEEALAPVKEEEKDEYTALRELAGGKMIFCSGPLFTDKVVYGKHGF